MDGIPEFPAVHGSARVSQEDRDKIASAAWQNANGDQRYFEQLCAQHLRGEIDLFSDAPTAIGGGNSLPRPENRTAIGGATMGRERSAALVPEPAAGRSVGAAPQPMPGAAERVGRAGAIAAEPVERG